MKADFPNLEQSFCSIFDGDTASDERLWIRERVHILFTNFDSLHVSILPHHIKWCRFLRQLEIIVIDELDAYRACSF